MFAGVLLLVPLDRLLWRSGGFQSRDEARAAITDGRVAAITDNICVAAGASNKPVDCKKALAITLDGKPLPPLPPTMLTMLHKPRGVLTTCSQSASAQTVMDVLPAKYRRPGVAPVGRLDKDTEGLLLLTNDGTLAKLLLERGACSKTYVALVEPRWPKAVSCEEYFNAARLQMERGIELPNGYLARAARCRQLDEEAALDVGCARFDGLLDDAFGSGERETTSSSASRPCMPSCALVEVVMRQGAKREVRRLLRAAGYRTVRLCRVAVGGVTLGDLASGAATELSRAQLLSLYSSTCSACGDERLRAMPAYDDAGAGAWVEARELAARAEHRGGQGSRPLGRRRLG